MKKIQVTWTEELIDKLKDLYINNNLTFSQIAKELNVTKNSVIGKIHRLKLNTVVNKNKNISTKKSNEDINTKTQKNVLINVKFDSYTLEEIDSNMCVWAITQEDDSDFLFCGREVVFGKSYCQKHLDMVYLTNKKISKKKKDNVFYAEDVKD